MNNGRSLVDFWFDSDSQYKERHVRDSVVELSDSLFSSLAADVKVKYERKTDISSTICKDVDKDKYLVEIGMRNVHLSAKQNKGYVRDSSFIIAAKAVFHEYRHVVQHSQICKYSVATETERDVAKDVFLTHAFPTYYHATYDRNMMELDAELFAVKNCRQYFKQYFPDIDVDRYLVESVNAKLREEPKRAYIKHKVNSYDDIVASLEESMACRTHSGVQAILTSTCLETDKGLIREARERFPGLPEKLNKMQYLYEQRDCLCDYGAKYGREYKRYAPVIFMSGTDLLRHVDPPDFSSYEAQDERTFY